MSFSFEDFTVVFFVVAVNVLILRLGIASQKLKSLEFKCCWMKLFICCCPHSTLVTNASATSVGNTTPIAMLHRMSLSLEKGSFTRPDLKEPTISCTSFSSRCTLLGATSLWVWLPTLSGSLVPHICLTAVVIAAFSWLVKNHRCNASAFRLIPTMPPRDLESKLMGCSKCHVNPDFRKGLT